MLITSHKKTSFFISAFISLIAFIIIAYASRPIWTESMQETESPFSIAQITHLSDRVNSQMAAKDVQVFIIARAGRPPEKLPAGIQYTHIAFGVYSGMEDDSITPSYAIYNLYQDNENKGKSNLITDGTIDFLMGLRGNNVRLLIPIPALQEKLRNLIGTTEYTTLHNPNYSYMSNPNNSKYQNCTEHTLDVINSALYETSNQDTLKLLALENFEPQTVNFSQLKIMLGSIFSAGITLADHRGKVRTATFTTLTRYLEKSKLVQEMITIDM
jgi:hypothetical protein